MLGSGEFEWRTRCVRGGKKTVMVRECFAVLLIGTLWLFGVACYRKLLQSTGSRGGDPRVTWELLEAHVKTT